MRFRFLKCAYDILSRPSLKVVIPILSFDNDAFADFIRLIGRDRYSLFLARLIKASLEAMLRLMAAVRNSVTFRAAKVSSEQLASDSADIDPVALDREQKLHDGRAEMIRQQKRDEEVAEVVRVI